MTNKVVEKRFNVITLFCEEKDAYVITKNTANSTVSSRARHIKNRIETIDSLNCEVKGLPKDFSAWKVTDTSKPLLRFDAELEVKRSIRHLHSIGKVCVNPKP